MWEFGSERKLSRGSETETGEEDEDGFAANERGSSLSLLLAMIGVDWMKGEGRNTNGSAWRKKNPRKRHLGGSLLHGEVWNQGVAAGEWRDTRLIWLILLPCFGHACGFGQLGLKFLRLLRDPNVKLEE